MSEASRLRGSLLRLVQEEKPPVVFLDEPEVFVGDIKLTFKDAGSFVCGHMEIEVLNDSVVIHDFARSPHLQKSGYGRACFARGLTSILKRAPDKPILLSVVGNNKKAIDIYREYGFEFENPQAVQEKPNDYHTMRRG